MSSSREKGNRLERAIMPVLLERDGPDPAYAALSTSTGRVGHLYSLQLDGVTRRLAVQARNRESIGDWLFTFVTETRATAAKHEKVGINVLKKNRRRPLVVMDFEDFCDLITTGESS